MHKLHLPRLGQTMERGTIQSWLKKEGEPFEVGEPLFEVETEKVVTEIEAKLPGTIARIVVPEGEEHPVGTLLAVVADPGEELSEEQIGEAIAEEEEEGTQEVPVEEPARSAEAQREAPARAGGGRVRAMPKARKLARELGVDLSGIEGTGKGGSITTEDVRAAAEPGGGPKVLEKRPLTGIGRTMAEIVGRSWREIPQFVQMVQLDASALVERRKSAAGEVKQNHGVDLSYTDLFLEALVGAVGEQPLANSSLVNGEIVVYEDVNVSVAVATDAGLLVPVLRGAQGLSLGELASRFREVAGKAREGKLGAQDLEGGTITLSNLGMHGVESGTPLVTAPQAAIAFFGAMVERPWVVDGRVEVRPVLSLSVGYDHRILDGASAARFTTALRQRLEAPAGGVSEGA